MTKRSNVSLLLPYFNVVDLNFLTSCNTFFSRFLLGFLPFFSVVLIPFFFRNAYTQQEKLLIYCLWSELFRALSVQVMFQLLAVICSQDCVPYSVGLKDYGPCWAGTLFCSFWDFCISLGRVSLGCFLLEFWLWNRELNWYEEPLFCSFSKS